MARMYNDPVFNSKYVGSYPDILVNDWLMKHFKTLEQIKEYSSIQIQEDIEGYVDLVFESYGNSDNSSRMADDDGLTSDKNIVISWLDKNFTTIPELKEYKLKEKKKREYARKNGVLSSRYVPCAENGYSVPDPIDVNILNVMEHNNDSNSSNESESVSGADHHLCYLGVVNQNEMSIKCYMDDNIPPDFLKSYPPPKSSLDPMFFKNVKYYPKWLMGKRNKKITDGLIKLNNQSTAL